MPFGVNPVPFWVVGGATLYSIGLLLIGWYANRVLDLNVEDYMVASRRVGTVLVGVTLVATLMSAVILIGAPGTITFNGIGVVGAYAFYIFFVAAIVWIIGTRIWALGERYEHVTPADLVGDMFESDSLRMIVSGALFFWMFVFCLAQFVGAATVFETVTEGIISFEMGLLWIAVVVGIYIAFGGIRGSVFTDLIQGVIFLTIAFGLFAVIAHVLTTGGILNVFREAAAENPEIMMYQSEGLVWNSTFVFSFVIFVTVGLSFTPYIYQRFYLASSVKNLKKSIVLFTLGWLLYIPVLILGYTAVYSASGVTNPDQIAPTLALGAGTLAAILFSIAAIAASMSTSDSLTFALGSLLSRDFYQKVFRPNASQRKVTRVSQGVMVGVVVALFLVGLVPQFRENVIPLAVLASAGWAQVGFPILATLLWPRAKGTGIAAGILVGTAALVLLYFNGYATIYGLHAAIWAGLLNLLVFAGISLASTDSPDHPKFEYYYYMDQELEQR